MAERTKHKSPQSLTVIYAFLTPLMSPQIAKLIYTKYIKTMKTGFKGNYVTKRRFLSNWRRCVQVFEHIKKFKTQKD